MIQPSFPDAARLGILDRFQELYCAGSLDAALPTRWYTLNAGLSGIAYALFEIGRLRADHAMIERADALASFVVKEIDSLELPDSDLERVGYQSYSLFHSITGVLYVAAIIKRHIGSISESRAHCMAFCEEIRQRRPFNYDLTLGVASALIGVVNLLSVFRDDEQASQSLFDTGAALYRRLLVLMGDHRSIRGSSFDGLTFAHGWSGLLYAIARYCKARAMQPPDGFQPLLESFIAEAKLEDEGAYWDIAFNSPSLPWAASSWCNGSAGHAFLLAVAFEETASPNIGNALRRCAYLVGRDVKKASWSVCCGLAGQAFALLRTYEATREDVWLHRAIEVAEYAATCAIHHVDPTPNYHGLFKGLPGLAILAEELRSGRGSFRMPIVQEAIE